jgi:glycine betaine/choline ABC-type transport system substrate-binding protein
MATIIKQEVKTIEIVTTSEVVDLTGTNALAVAKKLADARELKKLSDEMEAEAKAEAAALMGDAKFGMVDGVKIFQRMAGKSTGIDRDVLKAAFPEAFEATFWEKATHWFKVVG